MHVRSVFLVAAPCTICLFFVVVALAESDVYKSVVVVVVVVVYPGPPDPPPAPRVHIESLDRIWFSWNRPFAFENYSITNFTISVRDHPEWTRVVTEQLDRENFSLPITADSATLRECEELFFSVMAMNKIGASDEAFAAAGGFPIGKSEAINSNIHMLLLINSCV